MFEGFACKNWESRASVKADEGIELPGPHLEGHDDGLIMKLLLSKYCQIVFLESSSRHSNCKLTSASLSSRILLVLSRGKLPALFFERIIYATCAHFGSTN